MRTLSAGRLVNREQPLMRGSFHHFVDVNGGRPLTIQPDSHMSAGTIFKFSLSVKSDRTLRKPRRLNFATLYFLDMLNADRQNQPRRYRTLQRDFRSFWRP
jgi:hypothetical protein